MRANWFAFVRAANNCRGIFNHDEIVFACNVMNRVNICGETDLMHGHDGAHARRNFFFQQLRIDVVGARVNINENRRGARVQNAVGGGNETVGRDQHFVAGTDAQRNEREMQRGGAVRYR